MRAPSTAARFLVAAVACLISAATHPAEACCQLGGTQCGDPFAVSCNNGVVCFPPWRSCPGCTCTATNAGNTCLATTEQPGTVAALQVTKNTTSGSDLDFSWSASCAASGPDYSVYEGQLGAWYSHGPRGCSSGHALSLTIAPAGGDRYYLVAPITTEFTGSLGTTAMGTERPDAESSCTSDRALAPCP